MRREPTNLRRFRSAGRPGLVPLVLLLPGALLSASVALAADVALNVADTRGQGSLLRRGNECLVITPRHVIEDKDGNLRAMFKPVEVTYADRSRTTAKTLERFGEDVALLRLEEQPRAGCRDERFAADGLDRLLGASTEGVLKRRTEDGSDAFTPVAIASHDAYDSIRVEPALPSGSIDQGDSGSVLYIENRPVGMLTDLDEETGLGVVMRADKLMSVIAPFMAASQRDASLFLSLDANSAFLETALSREARRRGVALADDRDAASLQLIVTSDETRLDTDTGKVVRYATRIEVVDALDNLVMEREIAASGNSFVSLDAAADNAREDLATRLERAALLDSLP